ncbi:Uncharacterised protein [Vibrio cholerae]|nr:Uncharacterised protein [Vibrio cholerae]
MSRFYQSLQSLRSLALRALSPNFPLHEGKRRETEYRHPQTSHQSAALLLSASP